MSSAFGTRGRQEEEDSLETTPAVTESPESGEISKREEPIASEEAYTEEESVDEKAKKEGASQLDLGLNDGSESAAEKRLLRKPLRMIASRKVRMKWL